MVNWYCYWSTEHKFTLLKYIEVYSNNTGTVLLWQQQCMRGITVFAVPFHLARC